MIERNHEVRQGAIAALLSVAALTGSIYTGKALDYRDVFIPGTTINGIEADGRTVEEMEELLGEYRIDVAFRDGKDAAVEGSDIDFHYVSDGSLDRILKAQNPFMWLYGVYQGTSYEIREDKAYDEEKLISILQGLPQMQKSDMIPTYCSRRS